MISRTLAIELMSAIGRWLLGFLRSLPDFGIITIVTDFHVVGKCWYFKQQLNIFVSARNVLSEKCGRAVLEILSGPGALLRCKLLMMFNFSWRDRLDWGFL